MRPFIVALYALLAALAAGLSVREYRHGKAALGTTWAVAAILWVIVCVGMSFSGVIV